MKFFDINIPAFKTTTIILNGEEFTIPGHFEAIRFTGEYGDTIKVTVISFLNGGRFHTLARTKVDLDPETVAGIAIHRDLYDGFNIDGEIAWIVEQHKE